MDEEPLESTRGQRRDFQRQLQDDIARRRREQAQRLNLPWAETDTQNDDDEEDSA
jgi:hypothetical protein